MSEKSLAQRLHQDLAAHTSAKARVRRKVMQRIQAPVVTPVAVGALEKLQHILTPSAALRTTLHERLLPRLRVVPVSAKFWPQGALRLTAAFALLALAVRLSPSVFLATPTVADSAVSILPTRGEVSVLVGDMWQPLTGETLVQPGTKLRTADGEASILFHDDGVVRLDARTTIEIHDISDRSNTNEANASNTLTLFTGRVWVQGLVPSHIRGLTVETSYGTVTVNEGSVSIAEDDVVDVLVYNRRAVVDHNNTEIVLVSGERTQMWEGNVPLLKKISDASYEQLWARQNLGRDAVHQKEIAQLQQERRAARAGILPTSRLYPVKRVAETVDVLLTFSADARTQKRIDQAQRRLDEAAALLEEDQDAEAEIPLAEFRDMLQALAQETNTSVTDALLQQSLSETSADVAAVQPEDEAYLLKLAVLEASTQLDSDVGAKELEAVLLMDALAAMNGTLQDGNIEEARADWVKIQSSLSVLDDETLPSDVQKEVLGMIGRFAQLVEANEPAFTELDPELVEQVAAYAPAPDGEPLAMTIMSDAELTTLVKGIRGRIFLYHMTRSRLNQLLVELKALSGHPEEGRILRRLYSELPGGPENFPDRIKKEITRLRWEKAGETL